MMSTTNPIEGTPNRNPSRFGDHGSNEEVSSQDAENHANTGETAGLQPFDPNVVGTQGRGPQGTDKGGAASLGHQVEFLPKHVRQQRLQRRRLIRQGYLLVVCVTVMGILTYVRGGRVAQARANLATLEKSRSNLQRQAEMITPLERQMSDLLIKKRIDEELGGRTDCTIVLAELCRITPLSIVMVSLDLQTVKLTTEASGYSGRSSSRAGGSYHGSRPTVVGKTGAGSAGGGGGRSSSRMVITGLAMNDVDVANFIGQLAASKLFRDVNMGYTKTIVFRGRSAREFQASCYLVK